MNSLEQLNGLGSDAKFKNTPIGKLPNEWNVKYLPDVSINLDSKRKPIKSTDRADIQGKYPYYGASGIIDYVNDFIFDGEYILLGEDGENVLSRNLPLAFIVKGKSWVNNHAHVLQAKTGTSLKFLCEYLESLDYRNIASGSAQPKITQGALNDIVVPSPPFEEQQKIASILTAVDEVIASTAAQINKLKDLKTGMMQELLTKGIGHTEFKDSPVGRIPKAWEIISIGQLGDVITGNTPKTNEPENYGGVIPFISPADIGDHMYVKESKSTLTVLGLSKTRQLPQDAILVVCIGSTIGKTGIATRICATNQQINAIVCKDNDFRFVYYLMTYISKVIKGMAGTQAVPIINKTDFCSLLVQRPPIKEQLTISCAISAVDQKISVLEMKRNSIIATKKALMQDLLTGAVRVTGDC